MSEPKFTPGPWVIHECTRYGDRSQYQEYEIWSDHCDVLVATEVRRAHNDGGYANVCLIAAAPDMYEALKYLADNACTDRDGEHVRLSEAYAALAKAEGKT